MDATGKLGLTWFCILVLYCLYFVNRRGARPEIHRDASGGLIRSIMITLDELKFTEKTEKGGRRITKIGQQALDLVAGQIANEEH
ncbi:hypothetical protein EON64_03620 [archaeon]|nr:MAG: hypothetical protein EON64_03620 [archaeon]